MRLLRLLLTHLLVFSSHAFACDRAEIIDEAAAANICQKTRWPFPAMPPRRGGWSLLVALATLALGAMDASGYDLSAGGAHTCAVDDNGVTCWGNDSWGQSTVPAGLTNPRTVTAGTGHTCALDDNGVTCWGQNNYGQSTVAAGLVNPSAVAAGGQHTCAVDDNGVTCWGNSGLTTVPAGLVNPSAVTTGDIHSCALDDNGVTCWGSDSWGQSTVPAGLTNPRAVAAGAVQSCALDDNGVTCWGYTTIPAEVVLVNPRAVAAGMLSCALDDNGVTCWGTTIATVPAGLTNLRAVAAGGTIFASGYHTCALDDNGVTCWGDNGSGQTTVPCLVFSAISDGDGVSSTVENGAPNGGDGNGDGTPDADQADVASLPDGETGAAYLTAEVGGACSSICKVQATSESAAAAPDPFFDFDFGLIGFRLPCTSGTVKLYFHGTTGLSPPYRKYGPTTPGVPGTIDWYTLPTAVYGSEVVGGQTVATVTLTLMDGALGDDTGVDGEIVDEGGPGVLAVTVPALGASGRALLGLALVAQAALVAVRLQRRRAVSG